MGILPDRILRTTVRLLSLVLGFECISQPP
jgi:hypothetical protein